jgi:hypothetical protein
MTEATKLDRGRARRLVKELRAWALGAVGAIPIVVAFTVIEPRLPVAWQGPAFVAITIVPLLIIGLLSRSTTWVLLVWLAPIIATYLAFLLGVSRAVLTFGWIFAALWVGGMMLYEPFSRAVVRTVDPAFQRLVEAGLSSERRRSYREFRRAVSWTPDQTAAVRQLDDVWRATEVLRETGARISSVQPPDLRWAAMLRAAAKSFLVYAEMRGGARPLDMDEAKALLDRRDDLIGQLLRADSVPYRILTFVPGSLFSRLRSTSARTGS